MSEHIAKLHSTFVRRETPETVAKLVAVALPVIDPGLRAMLGTVTGAAGKGGWSWSSMPTEFQRPTDATRQVAKAVELAEAFLDEELPHGPAMDSDTASEVARMLSSLIGRQPGEDFKAHANRARRSALGLDLSRRRYLKLFRLAQRLEGKAARLLRLEQHFELTLVGKAALAPRLTIDDLGEDVPTAAFVAYFAARMKLRSVFWNGPQQRPFDELSNALLDLCFARSAQTRWMAIAHVFPREDVLACLTDHERGRLLGIWFSILDLTAEHLERAYRESAIDLETMIVRRGNDSTTWNLLAGAWNRARDNWIALVQAMGISSIFDEMLPGKVLRLMAGDVARWHLASGGGLHPDTLVWRDLPKPWSVLRGDATCTLGTIVTACHAHKVDPVQSGWGAPRARTEIAEFRPTPELVHGVAVSNPFLADFMRKSGWFSGKPTKTIGAG